MFSLFLSCIILISVTLSVTPSMTAADVVIRASGDAYINQSYLEDQLYSGNDLGAVYTPQSTTWKVWAPTATKMQLKLYYTGSDSEAGAGVIATHDMTKTGSCYSIQLSGNWKNKYYTYLVTTNGQTNETQDVYSKATGVNGRRSMVIDLSSTNPQGWDQDGHVLFDNAGKAAVWEIHVRDFSISETSGVSEENRGKYLAFTEGGTKLNGQPTEISTGIDYLVEQGIKCVQIMPMYDFQTVDETKSNERNWGYDPMNFNVPEGSYSSNPYDGNVRVMELKRMVQALHDRGISVVMDVVYNHVCDAVDSCFEKTVPGYYLRKYGMGAYEFSSGSGCGNETASDKAMFRKYMIDSVKYWANEYHIDGFRFDLMGLHDAPAMNELRNALDTINPKILVYGEPWTGGLTPITNGCSQDRAQDLSDRVGMFSDSYRNAFHGGVGESDTGWGYLMGNTDSTDGIVKGLTASSKGYKSTEQVVSYADCHDNYPLWDNLLRKQNAYGQWNSTDAKFRSQMRLALGLLTMSQGITFQNAGTEFARTKKGDHNSYKSNDDINAIDWTRLKTYATEASYYRGLLEIRSHFSPITGKAKAGSNYEWLSTWGNIVGVQISNTTPGEWGKLLLLYNCSDSGISMNTAQYGVTGWKIVANSTTAGLTSLGDVSNNYSVPGRSCIILAEASTFNNLSAGPAKFGTLTTEHYNEGGQLLKKTTAKYRVGTTYRAVPDQSILFDNTLVKTEGNVTGIVTEGFNATIKFTYASTGIASGYLTVKYTDNSGKAVAPDQVTRLKQGDAYEIRHVKAADYQLDTSKYPAETVGIFDGNDKTVTFYYKPLDTQTTTVHYYNSKSWGDVSFYAYTDLNEKPLGEWAATAGNGTNEGNGWWMKVIPVPKCYVILRYPTGNAQEPGQDQAGYPVSGEVWIRDGGISEFSNKVIVSHINLATGARLVADEVQTNARVKSTDTYTTSVKTSFDGKTIKNTILPNNANGNQSAGVVNVVYLYEIADVLPTDPPESTSSTNQTNPTQPTQPSSTNQTNPTQPTQPSSANKTDPTEPLPTQPSSANQTNPTQPSSANQTNPTQPTQPSSASQTNPTQPTQPSTTVTSGPRYEVSSAKARAGDTVTITVSIKDNPGIITCQIRTLFDENALELTGVENTGLLNGFRTPAPNISSPYRLLWMDSSSMVNNSANGVIAKLNFKVKNGAEPGDYNVSVEAVEAMNASGGSVSFANGQGKITVIDFMLGDLDRNGKVNTWDAVLFERYLAGWNVSIDLLAADINGDGNVTTWDAILLERYLAGWDIEYFN